MSSNSNSSNTKQNPMNISYKPYSLTTNNTTFVRANPSNFRALVQHLTGYGSGSGSSTPATATDGGGLLAQRVVDVADVGVSKTAPFKLHERRQQGGIRKLEMIKVNNNHTHTNCHGPINGLHGPKGGHEVAMVSPVSTLDGVDLGLGLGLPSPSPRINPSSSLSEEGGVVIAQKGFYLHPISPFSGTFNDYEPQLLPLFPIHSPTPN